MRFIALLISVFLLSGCATEGYYKYLTAKEEREYWDKEIDIKLKTIDNEKQIKDKQLINERFLKEKELANTLEIERYKIEQDTKLKEKELQMEKEKYEF